MPARAPDPTGTGLRHWRHHLDPATGWAAGHPHTSVLGLWASRWRRDPAAPLFLQPAGEGVAHQGRGQRVGLDPGGWWTAGQFEEATRRAAGRLRAAGLVPGDRMVWSVRSSVPAVVAHVAALRAGLVVVPVNTAATEAELTTVSAAVRPSVAVVDDVARGAWIRGASGVDTLAVGPELDLGDGDAGVLDAARPDDPALICFTSGTTGAAKGAVLTHRNLLAATTSVVAAWRWTPEDRLVHCLPVFHAHGLCVGVYGTLASGGSAVLLPGFDPGVVLDAVIEHRATLFFGVPTMYHRLLRAPGASRMRRLRLCVSGSAPLAAELQRQVSAAVGQSVLERYGMTETLMNVSNPYDGERRPGSVGFPLPGVEVDLAPDGEILLRGPNVFDRYWERPAETAAVFRPASDDGGPWFASGDLGEVEDGYLFIRGRSKELIISGGFNVYPGEVEDAIVSFPGVVEAAVTGTPSDEWGEVVTAWVVTDGPVPSAGQLAAHTARVLAPYKRPRLVRSVEALPRNSLGKVLRHQLDS